MTDIQRTAAAVHAGRVLTREPQTPCGLAGNAPPALRAPRRKAKGDLTEERELAEKTLAAAQTLGGGRLYGVVYADPPWRFEPCRETGIDRAACNASC